MHTPAPVRPLSVEDVQRMLAAGILSVDEPVELIEGALIVVNPQGPVHAGAVARIRALLEARLPEDRVVREEKPLWVSDISLPEPDLAVVPRAEDFYVSRHPRADEAALVVEVAFTSRDLDRSKAALYARGGVPEYWIANLPARRLEVHTDPRPEGRYVTRRDLGEDDTVRSPWGALEVADILGPALTDALTEG